jgi:hypothetical protein
MSIAALFRRRRRQRHHSTAASFDCGCSLRSKKGWWQAESTTRRHRRQNRWVGHRRLPHAVRTACQTVRSSRPVLFGVLADKSVHITEGNAVSGSVPVTRGEAFYAFKTIPDAGIQKFRMKQVQHAGGGAAVAAHTQFYPMLPPGQSDFTRLTFAG